MTPERDQQISALFHAARALPLAQRRAFLAQASADDDELRREVEALLAGDEQAGEFLNLPAPQIAASLWAEHSTSFLSLPAGRQFDHYRILSRLGAGGMGEVYLAEDTKLERRVALKFLSAHFTAAAEPVHRFIREARAASALNHPNIITIHEIGQAQTEAGKLHFIVTEYIEGETLRERLRRERLSLNAALETALQIAGALSAAHEAGIIHRDIKPENVMLRPDGLVKVLDFGLAKLSRLQIADYGLRIAEGETLQQSEPDNLQSTQPGMVMGTPQYMSPEQARGQRLDARTDVFSLGVVLYEMLAGCAPFEGATALEVVGAILYREPAPLAPQLPDAPSELEHIVMKALRKDREQRYQTSKDLLIDLRDVRDELALAARTPENTARSAPARTDPMTALATHASGQFSALFRRRWLRASVALAVLLVATVATFLYFNRTRQSALSERDTILLGGFRNRTGDEVFDGTLRQGLAIQLAQTPFLQLFSEQRMRETLQQMGRSPDDLVTAEVGREICERQGLKAVITGDISLLGSHYVLTLEAISGPTGETLAREQLEAPAKEQVLQALSQAASNLRKKLGESLASVEKYSALLEVTTTSLPALKAYTLGLREHREGRHLQAIPFLQRAVELDANFASAWANLGVMFNNTGQPQRAAESATRAFALRDRVTEQERFRIIIWYYDFATGEIEPQIEVLEQYRKTYPRDAIPLTSLFRCYSMLGQFEQAEAAAREALRLTPWGAVSYVNHAYALMRLNQLSESRAVLQRLEERQRLPTSGCMVLFSLAALTADEATQRRVLDQLEGQSEAHRAWQLRAEQALFRGQWRQAQELTRRGQEFARRQNNRSLEASFTSLLALHRALLNTTASTAPAPQIAREIQEALALERDRNTLSHGALAHALSGHVAQSQALQAELAQRYPRHTLITLVWLPVLRAALALRSGQGAQALEQLRAAERYENEAQFWPPYLRGLAYLQLRAGSEAATEFRKITTHRSYAPLSPLWPLAHLGLARALSLTGNAAESKKVYEAFFSLWKEADADLPILREARREAERLP